MEAKQLRRIGLALVLLLVVPCVVVCAQFSIQLPGSVQPGTYTGNSIDFGDVEVGTTKTVTYRFGVTSTSSTAGSLTFIGFQGGFFRKPPFALTNLPSLPKNITPGGSITFNVTFTPTTVRTYTDQFTITVSGGWPMRTKQHTVTLTGTGVSYGGSIIDGDQPGDTVTYDVARLEAKLDALQPNVATLETKLDLAQQDNAKLEAKLDELRQKLNNLAGILGEWIVGRGQQFYIDTGTTVYNPTPPTEGIKTEIETLERQINTLITECCTSEPAEEEWVLPPIEVTEDSGERFLHFLSLCSQLVTETREDLMGLEPPDTYTETIIDAFAVYVMAVQPEIDELIALTRLLPLETQAYLDSVVVDGTPELLSQIIDNTSGITKYDLSAKEKGSRLVVSIIAKGMRLQGGLAAGFPGPLGTGISAWWNVLADDIEKLFGSNAEMCQLLSGLYMSQLELELKLVALVKGLLGVDIDLSEGTKAEADALGGIESYDLPKTLGRQVVLIDKLEVKLDELQRRLEQDLADLRVHMNAGFDNVLRGQSDIGETLDVLKSMLESLGEKISELESWLKEKLDWLLNRILVEMQGAERRIQASIVAAEVNIRESIAAAEANIRDDIAAAEANIRGDIAAAEANIRGDIGTAERNILRRVADAEAVILDGITANGALILRNSDAIGTNADAIVVLTTLALSQQDATNRIEDKLSQLLDLPAAPDGEKITLVVGGGPPPRSWDVVVEGSAGAVEPGALVTLYWPNDEPPSCVTADETGTFFFSMQTESRILGFIEVSQTVEEQESSRVLVRSSP